jgi:caa(3)-type oxidase subunit IV
MRTLLIGWAGLLALLAVQIGLAHLPLGAAHLWFALAISAAMATIVAWLFMELAKAPHLARIFAYGGLFWIMALFALGGADYATRAWNRATEIPALPEQSRER